MGEWVEFGARLELLLGVRVDGSMYLIAHQSYSTVMEAFLNRWDDRWCKVENGVK